MKLKQIPFVLTIFILVACIPAPATSQQPNVETIVAGTLQALTSVPIQPAETLPANATPVPVEVNTQVNGKAINFGKISFVIPTGVATGSSEIKKEAIPPSEGMPWWEVRPASVEYELIDYALTGTFHDAKIYVYPIAEYIAMNDSVAEMIGKLQSINANPTQPLPERLPYLPTWNAGPMFYSNHGEVNFQNGTGIRYITEHSQFPHLITNNGMFYTFQGITNDGLYYVSAVLPINIEFLNGYPTPTDQGDFVFIENEVKKMTDQLNNSSPESFTPSITALDALIQSITVTGIP